ncbi:MAG: histidine kinase dimerization/phospho-acceptor domain-containing protein, partial [Streptococcus thermophilus]
MSKLFGKVTIRKKLTMTTAVVFFLVLSMFTLVVVFSANTLLLQRERQNVNNTISKVVTYIEKDWDSDEELSPEPLLAAFYSPKNIYPSIINGVLSEKRSLDGQVAVSNRLYSNQSVYVYDKKGTFIFTSEEDTDSPPGMSEVNKLKLVSYKGKRGFLLQVPIYGKDKKTIVGYAQVFHDLKFYYALKERLIFLLIFLEVGMTVLVIAVIVVVLTSILRPMRQLHETMGIIIDSPSDLELRSKIESHDEIGALALNFNCMMDKIQENNQMQMRFLSDVSHELRTPIAVIKGHMDLLQRWGKNDPEILEESLEAASHEANRMTIMINDMLDSIRVKGSFDNHRNDTCDLNSSIRT